MKKYLFLFLSIFSFIFINDNVFALDYQVNGNTFQVTDVETLRDYCYYSYVLVNSNYNWRYPGLYVFKYSNDYFCAYSEDINKNGYPILNLVYNQDYQLNYLYDRTAWKNKTNRFVLIKFDSSFNYISKNNSNSSNFNLSYAYSCNNCFINYYSTEDIYLFNNNSPTDTLIFNANFSYNSIVNKYSGIPNKYIITYYLNNSVYRTIEVEEGSSHTLLYYEPSSEYNFSGWSYDNNIDLTNITSNVDIIGTTSLKPYYTITYYLNNSVYDTISVIEGTNYILANYVPPRNYTFSGWSYDNNIDLTNITSNVDIFGTTTYVRPTMNYSENIDSIIHSISYQILGNSIPVEFDFLYTIMDFIILIIIIFCILAPFLILIKLLGGRF